MDRTDEGNMGDLDEADQLPVKHPTKDANPICYICSSNFTEFDGTTKLMTGIYSPESIDPYFRNREGGGWCRFYRMSMPALVVFASLPFILLDSVQPT